MSKQSSDYKIIPLGDEFVFSGETKEFSYKIVNMTNHKIKLPDFNVGGEFVEMIKAPLKELKAHEEAEFTIRVKVPDNYDEDHNIGLRPRILGQLIKEIP